MSNYYSKKEARKKSKVEYLDFAAYEPQDYEKERTIIEYEDDELNVEFTEQETARALRNKVRAFVSSAKNSASEAKRVVRAFTGGDSQYEEAALEIISIFNSPVEFFDRNSEIVPAFGVVAEGKESKTFESLEDNSIYNVDQIAAWRAGPRVIAQAIESRLEKVAFERRYHGIKEICLDTTQAKGKVRQPGRRPRHKSKRINKNKDA
jgi:hypothetical protein